MLDKKAYIQFQKFKFWLECGDNYKKINKSFAFKFDMKDASLEEYLMHDHVPRIDEIVWEFYTCLEPFTEEVSTYALVRWLMV